MARRFTNGTTDEIDFGSFAALEGVGAATFAVWLKKRTADDYFSHLLCKTASGPDGMNLMHGASGFGDDGIYASVSLAGTEGDLYINTVFTVDVWYHVALRFDGSQTGNDRLHLYINGAQQSVSRGLTSYPATIGGSGASSGTGGQTSNASTITFPAPTANWGTVTHFGIYDAAPGGNLLICQQLTAAKNVSNGDAAPSFAIDALTVTFQ